MSWKELMCGIKDGDKVRFISETNYYTVDKVTNTDNVRCRGEETIARDVDYKTGTFQMVCDKTCWHWLKDVEKI